VLRAADARMAALVEADPRLDPENLLAGLPRDLWGALVSQVIGQQPRTDAQTLRRIGCSDLLAGFQQR
jgi:hypothetical protein